MFTRVWFIVKYWLLWILFFEMARLAFLFANYRELKAAGWGLSFQSLWYGLRMDLSAAAYITLPLGLLVLLSVFIAPFRKSIIYSIYTGIILLLVLLILFADVGLYQAWGTRVDATPLKYLANPKEVWASVSHLPITLIVLAFMLLYVLLQLAFNSQIKQSVYLLAHSSKRKMISALCLVALLAAFIIPLRGGLQLAPLNQSSVYFSQNNFANLAALNAPWNFLRSLSRRSVGAVNPFVFDDVAKVNVVVDSLMKSGISTQQIVNIGQGPSPNIIFIIWESFTSKAVGLLAEGKIVTPHFNQLMKEGVFFSDIYATGDRTDKGIVGILSGYPAQSTASIIKEPVKAAKLPMLSKVFKDRGYSTSFYYGGELEFANMKAYLLQGKFDAFTTISNFNSKDQNSKWGAHDGVVAQKLQADLAKAKEPFFTTWLTLSSHEPYEIPAKPLISKKDDVSQFLSSVHYTDSVVYDFIRQAKQQTWWENTLVVIVADHGHRLPRADTKTDDFKIPLLMLGGAVKQPAQVISNIGSQTDLAATVLHQLGLPSKDFAWSRNLLDSTRSKWAFFTFNNGFGYVQPGKKLVYDNVGKRPIEQTGGLTLQDMYNGRALQQAAYQDFLNR